MDFNALNMEVFCMKSSKDVSLDYESISRLFSGKRSVYQKWIDANKDAINEAYDIDKEDLTKEQKQTLVNYRDCRTRINELDEMECAIVRTLYGKTVDFSKRVSDEEARMEIAFFNANLIED